MISKKEVLSEMIEKCERDIIATSIEIEYAETLVTPASTVDPRKKISSFAQQKKSLETLKVMLKGKENKLEWLRKQLVLCE